MSKIQFLLFILLFPIVFCAKHHYDYFLDCGDVAIGAKLVLDGKRDCDNGTDENPNAILRCADRSRSVYTTWVCDGKPDCTDGSDEYGCPGTV